ncbi:hypothetical protein J2S39_000449 [Corynebacterium guangdongense]|uniref:Uncharacterized protein n=1 Tax=Corynebacterium guangdongense TaxID=1783348 RepID=A0ABU1ZXZ8_9CORY|nr:hypothetical protein [Corynebacterium guangdongense]
MPRDVNPGTQAAGMSSPAGVQTGGPTRLMPSISESTAKHPRMVARL